MASFPLQGSKVDSFHCLVSVCMEVIPLSPPPPHLPTRTKGKAPGLSVKDVNAIMRAHGVKKTSEVSQCLKSAILHNKVKLLKPQDDPENKYGLDQVCTTVKKTTFSKVKVLCQDIVPEANMCGGALQRCNLSVHFYCGFRKNSTSILAHA